MFVKCRCKKIDQHLKKIAQRLRFPYDWLCAGRKIMSVMLHSAVHRKSDGSSCVKWKKQRFREKFIPHIWPVAVEVEVSDCHFQNLTEIGKHNPSNSNVRKEWGEGFSDTAWHLVYTSHLVEVACKQLQSSTVYSQPQLCCATRVLFVFNIETDNTKSQ